MRTRWMLCRIRDFGNAHGFKAKHGVCAGSGRWCGEIECSRDLLALPYQHDSMTHPHVAQTDRYSLGRPRTTRIKAHRTCMGCKFIQNSVTQMNIHIYSDTDIDTVKQMDNSTYLIFRHTKWTDVLKYIFPLLDVHPSILAHFIAIYLSIQTGTQDNNLSSVHPFNLRIIVSSLLI